MKRKEVGTVHYTACPGCQDELAVGWVGDRPVPMLKDPAKRATYAPDAQGMVVGPVGCGCGKTRLSLHPGAPGRAVVEWSTAEEPQLASTTVHGNPRDLARA